MVRTKTKAIALFLVLVLIFSFTSCSFPMDPDRDSENTDKDIQDSVTRAEFVRELALACGYDDSFTTDTYSFEDIKDHPCKNYIEYAAQRGFLDDFEDMGTYFKPNEAVTREFAAVIAVNCIGFIGADHVECEDEVFISYPEHANSAVNLGILSLQNGKFNPNGKLSLDEKDNIISFVQYAFPATDISEENYENLEYQDGVTVLDIEAPEPVNGVLTLPACKELENITAGSIIVINGDAAYQINTIERHNDVYKARVSTPDIQKVFKRIIISGTSSADPSTIKPIGDVVINNAPTVARNTEDTIEVKLPSVPIELTVPLGKCDLKVSVKLSEIKLKYKWDVDFGGSTPKFNNAYLVLEKTTDATVSLTTPEKDKINIFGTDVPSSIPLITIPFAGTKNFGCVVEVSLALSASGTFELAFRVVESNGMQILNNYPRIIDNTDCGMKSIKLGGEVGAGLEFDIKAEILNYDLISFQIEVGYKVEGNLEEKYYDSEHPEDNFYCIDASYSPYANITLFDDTLIEKWLKLKVSWELLSDDEKEKTFLHIENFSNVVSDCTYNTTTEINFKVVDLKSGGYIESSEGCPGHAYSYANFKTYVKITLVWPHGGSGPSDVLYENEFPGTSFNLSINIYDFVNYYDKCWISVDVRADRVWEHCDICCNAADPNNDSPCECDNVEEYVEYAGRSGYINEHITYNVEDQPDLYILMFDNPDEYWDMVSP